MVTGEAPFIQEMTAGLPSLSRKCDYLVDACLDALVPSCFEPVVTSCHFFLVVVLNTIVAVTMPTQDGDLGVVQWGNCCIIAVIFFLLFCFRSFRVACHVLHFSCVPHQEVVKLHQARHELRHLM